MAASALRNLMVHDYIRDPARLADAVIAAHEAVPMLVRFAEACHNYAKARDLQAVKPHAWPLTSRCAGWPG